MRFLLHHRPVHVATRLKAMVKSRARESPTTFDANHLCATVTGAVVDCATAPTELLNSNVTRLWGQQCGVDCGCVLRFEAYVFSQGAGDRTVQSASYHAKQVVTHYRPHDGSRIVVLTSKGRPMVKDSICPTLHHLATAAAQYLLNKTMPHLRNMVEFEQSRSSEALRRAVLTAQGLPKSDGGCFDLFEDALMALCKSHIPLARKCRPYRLLAGIDDNLLHFPLPPHWPDSDDGNGNDLVFGSLWRDLDKIVDSPLPKLSTLTMFDLNQHAQEEAADVGKRRNHKAGVVMPRDWVSYVDAMNEMKEQSA